MRPFRMQRLWWLATLVSCGSAVSLLDVLQSNAQLSSLSSLVSASPSATTLLAGGNNFTFLAPSNDAIARFNSQNPGVLNGSLLATVQYGFLKGGFPALSFTNTPQFVASNLTNATYANVTGGQVVELVQGSDGSPEIVSGNKSISTLSANDILCVGGIVHIIDAVLSIPIPAVSEVTAAGLQFFASILNVDGYLSTSATYVNQALELTDVTYFVPNSAAALATATQLAQNSSAADLEAVFEYHVVPSFVGYSTLLKTGMSLQTVQGSNLTITVQDGQIYVNSAQVIASDFIVANGVVHVIDNLLNRFDTSPPPKPTASSTTISTPAPTSTQAATTTPSPTQAASSHSSLSTGAKAGIGAGAGVAGLALLAVLACLLYRRKQKKLSSAAPWDNSSMSGATASPFNKFYVQRGQVQRQEDPGLGLQSAGMQVEDLGERDSEAGGEGPTIPARSPGRVLRRDGQEYF